VHSQSYNLVPALVIDDQRLFVHQAWYTDRAPGEFFWGTEFFADDPVDAPGIRDLCEATARNIVGALELHDTQLVLPTIQ
jgi:hypothetical protein